jgi:AhpD family alkylhydroperoxidase
MSKRTFDMYGFVRENLRVAGHFGDLFRVYVVPRTLTPGFREALMLAVTGVNRCAYCRYIHGKWGAASGLTSEQLEALLEGRFAGFSEQQTAALNLAVTLAENNGELPGGEVLERFEAAWEPARRREVLAVVRSIRLANLCWNTTEALGERLRGRPRPAEHGSVFSEIIIAVPTLLLGGPVYLGAKLLR